MPDRLKADLLIEHAAQLVVIRDDGEPRRGPAQGRLDAVADGAVAIAGERIVASGATGVVRSAVDVSGATVIDATGKVVMPGFVDPHTHPIFGGLRHDEYAMRLGGASVQEIFAKGGGMHRSVRETRAAADDDLRAATLRAFSRMLAQGTTTVEAKSGYGLTTPQELRSLQLLAETGRQTPLDLELTVLGAHFIPQEFEAQPDRYVDLIVDEMLPAVAQQGLATFCDVSVGDGTFTPEQATRMFDAARAHGLKLRAHVEGFTPDGGWAFAVRSGLTSADHVSATSDDDIQATGPTTTVATLIPAAEMVYLMTKRANARLMIDTGVPVAIATDYCSSIHVSSMQTSVGLACAWYRITPAEAVVAATLNAAYSIDRANDLGSLDPGKQADILVLDLPDVNVLAWGFGTDYIECLVKRGHLLIDRRVRDTSRPT